jgi:predicted MPP superfamily phosphohydrolase
VAEFDVLVGWRWIAGGVAGLTALVGVAWTPLIRGRAGLRRLGILGAAGAVALLFENLRGGLYPRLKQIDLCVDDLPPDFHGFTIGQLSDLHLGMPMSIAATRRAVALLMGARPDMIVLTGDFVSYRRHLPLLGELLRGLDAPEGVFAVLGNHDHLEGADVVGGVLERLGFVLLHNTHRLLRRGTGVLAVAGVDDMWRGLPDLEQAVAGVPRGAPIVLLAHAPDYADIAAQGPIAIQLSGHTHSGHIHVPVLGPLFLPRYGIYYHSGLQRIGRTWLYINSGLGGLPLRLGSRTEATHIRLRSVQDRS